MAVTPTRTTPTPVVTKEPEKKEPVKEQPAARAVGATVVVVASEGPTSLDAQVQNLVFAAGVQPPWPTVWPPVAPPSPMSGPGMVPYQQWVQTMAVRPYVTDPPPTPVVVSRYPGLTTN
jgi:hypothetical protein